MKYMKNTITPLLLFTFFLIETQLFSQEFFSMNAEALAKEIYYSRKNSGFYDEVELEQKSDLALVILAVNDQWQEYIIISLNTF